MTQSVEQVVRDSRRALAKHRRETRDVVVPENSFDLRQVCLAEKSAVGGRFQIDAADFHIDL